MHFGTHTPTHTTLLVKSKHRSAALPTQRWWRTHQHTSTLLVTSKPRSAAVPTQRWWGIWDAHNTNNTHNKNSSLCCALDCGKIIPSQKYRLVLTKPQNSNGRASNQTALRTTPWHANTLAAHTAHPLVLSLVEYTALLGVALELLRVCCSILPVWSAVSACGGDCVLQFGCFILFFFFFF